MSFLRRTIHSASNLRTSVIVALIAQIVVIWDHNPDKNVLMTFEYALTTTMVLYFSIITASTPYLRPFMASLQTGMIGNDDLRRRGQSRHSNALSCFKKSISSRNRTITNAMRTQNGKWAFNQLGAEGRGEHLGGNTRNVGHWLPARNASLNVQDESSSGGISYTVGYAVNVEEGKN